MPRHNESKLQQACVTWFRLQYAKYKKLFFAVPNGGSRRYTEAQILIGEGVVPGVSDTILLIPRHGHNCLCIEFKIGKGEQTPHQQEFQKEVEKHGGKYVIIRSVDEFMREINFYLNN